MGFLDRFKKEKNENINETQQTLPSALDSTITQDGKIQLEFYDSQADFKQFYDTTRLILNGQMQVNNTILTEALISYYSQNDAVMLNGNREIGRRAQYKKILMDVDINQLQSNPTYCDYVMKGLLNEKRVNSYLERGLQENPEQPCGNYVGGVRLTERGYGKVFDAKIGKMIHEALPMKLKREEYRRRQEQEKQDSIARKKAEIERLQQEINDIQK